MCVGVCVCMCVCVNIIESILWFISTSYDVAAHFLKETYQRVS